MEMLKSVQHFYAIKNGKFCIKKCVIITFFI